MTAPTKRVLLTVAAFALVAGVSNHVHADQIVSLVGDMDNFGYGVGNPIPNDYFDFASGSLPSGDGDVFDRESPGADPGTYSHFFTLPTGFVITSATLEIREVFSDNLLSTISIDGAVVPFVGPPGFSGLEPVIRIFSVNIASLLDGQLDIVFSENGDEIALDYSLLTINGSVVPEPSAIISGGLAGLAGLGLGWRRRKAGQAA